MLHQTVCIARTRLETLVGEGVLVFELVHVQQYVTLLFIIIMKQSKFNLERLTFSPLSLETCRLSLMSHLLPSTIFSTSAEACWAHKKGQMPSTRKSYSFHFVAIRGEEEVSISADSTNLFYVSYPVLDVFKRFLICDVVDKHDALKKKSTSEELIHFHSKNSSGTQSR